MRRILPLLLISGFGFCQLPSAVCDSSGKTLANCPFVAASTEPAGGPAFALTEGYDGNSSAQTSSFISPLQPATPEHFHWGRALFESFTYLSIAQAYVVHDDYRWVVIENGMPFNHYWRDYKQSLNTWIHSGWDDGDPTLYNYVGHPTEGALTGFIQIQNDPQGRDLEFGNTKAYWWSRFKAFWFASAYSTQWSIGPLSELTVEKYGTKARQPWNHNGTWPCYQHCVTGVGQVNLVITPTAGIAWILTEDFLDKAVAKTLEAHTRNLFLIDFTRCALNPVRGGANILHGKRPWFRASRDAHNEWERRARP